MLVRTMSRAHLRSVAVPRSAAPPLIGVVTHELLADGTPGWAPAPGRSERDLAPQRLSMRLTYTPGAAGGGRDRRRAARPRLRRRRGRAARPPRRAARRAAAPTSTPPSTARSRTPRSARRSTAPPTSTSWRCSAAAAERDLPLLGICRGLQALNVSRGGTLHQHLPDRSELAHLQRHEGFAPAHDVDVARGSLLHWLTGSDGLAVNSFHHQAADRIGAGLEVCARAPDGTVEALWDPAARFCLGVQWHAELLTHRAEQATLLQGLVDAACGLPAQLPLAA